MTGLRLRRDAGDADRRSPVIRAARFEVGDRVAVLAGHRRFPRVSYATIQRETAYHWVVDGVRFLKSTGLEKAPLGSMPPARIVRADDPWAAELSARQSRNALLTRVEDATEHLGGHPEDREAALAVVRAARAYLAALEGEPLPHGSDATGVPGATAGRENPDGRH